MKKMMCVLLAMMISFAVCAVAEEAPSIMVADMTVFSISVDNPDDDIIFVDPDDPASVAAAIAAGVLSVGEDGAVVVDENGAISEADKANKKWFYIRAVRADEVKYADRLQTLMEEIEALSATEDLVSYFGNVVDKEGNEIDILEALGTDTINVHEFHAVIANGYQEAWGKVTVDMQFPTPYEKDQKVLVLLGKVTYDEENERVISWIAYEAEVVKTSAEAETAWVRIQLEPETVMMIQEGEVLLAIASK